MAFEGLEKLFILKRRYNLSFQAVIWIPAPEFLFGKDKNRQSVNLEFVSQDRFRQSIEIFRRYNRDKTWSFTDCTSFVVMKELKIKTVFTFDDHFEQMGFRIL